MHPNVPSFQHSHDRQPWQGTLRAAEHNQNTIASHLTVPTESHDPEISLPYGQSTGSSSHSSYNPYTPQESQLGEPLPVELLLSLDGSGGSSSLSRSGYTNVMEPYGRQQIGVNGVEWFDGVSSSQSSRSTGYIHHGQDDGAALFVDEAIDTGTLNDKNQCKPFDNENKTGSVSMLMIAVLLFSYQGEAMGPSEQWSYSQDHEAAAAGYQEQSDADITLSQVIPEDYRSNTSPNNFMANAAYMPLDILHGPSTSAPWSTYSIQDKQMCHIPTSSEVLFAPEQVVPSEVQRMDKRSAQHMERKAKRRRGFLNGHSVDSKGEETLLKNVKSLPLEDPIGHPSSTRDSYTIDDLSPDTSAKSNNKGGRRGALDPKSREAARKVREKKSCWHCALTRGTVCCCSSLIDERAVLMFSLVQICRDRNGLPSMHENVFDICLR